jgi:hypothetical protein
MWDYICPKCKQEVKQKSHKCPNCSENYGVPLRVPPKTLKDKKALEEYVHKHVFPKVSAKQREYLTQFFTEIFSDGFESGDFSAWTGTYVDAGQTLEVSTEQKHHGTYSEKVICTDASKRAYAYKEWTTVETVYARIYVYVTQAVLNTTSRNIMFMMFHDKACAISTVGRTEKLSVGIISATRNFYIVYSNDIAGGAGSYTSTKTLSLNTWYCLEMMHTHGDGTNGIYRVYIDDVLEKEWTGLDTNDYKADRLKVGMVMGWYNVNDYGTWYSDCVVVADTYIGLESGVKSARRKLLGVGR